jgi:hypothetical protein
MFVARCHKSPKRDYSICANQSGCSQQSMDRKQWGFIAFNCKKGHVKLQLQLNPQKTAYLDYWEKS